MRGVEFSYLLDNLMLSNAIRSAVIGLTKSLSNELAGDGITVNSVLPGWTRTERVEQLLQAWADRDGVRVEEAAAGITRNIPAGRMGRPEELGDVVTFLASERAGFVNGVALQVDGGYHKAVYLSIMQESCQKWRKRGGYHSHWLWLSWSVA